MEHTANNESTPEVVLRAGVSSDTAAKSRKVYTPPQIQDFGRIADLTQNLANKSPGDVGGGSWST